MWHACIEQSVRASRQHQEEGERERQCTGVGERQSGSVHIWTAGEKCETENQVYVCWMIGPCQITTLQPSSQHLLRIPGLNNCVWKGNTLPTLLSLAHSFSVWAGVMLACMKIRKQNYSNDEQLEPFSKKLFKKWLLLRCISYSNVALDCW